MKFKLDNTLRSKIRNPVKVMWVRGRIVGTQFNERKLYEKGFGILSEFIILILTIPRIFKGRVSNCPALFISLDKASY